MEVVHAEEIIKLQNEIYFLQFSEANKWNEGEALYFNWSYVNNWANETFTCLIKE